METKNSVADPGFYLYAHPDSVSRLRIPLKLKLNEFKKGYF